MSVLTLDAQGLERVMASDGALVEFYTSDCPACRTAKAIVHNFADVSEVPVCTLNLADAPEAAEKLRIMSVPTFILFRDGRIVERRIGVQSIRELEKMTSMLDAAAL